LDQHMVLAQYIDRPDASLHIGLMLSLFVAWFGFLFAARRNGLGEAMFRIIFLLPALLVFIWITWSICGKGRSETGAMLTLFGSMGATVTVVALLLKRPRHGAQ
jgi:hypothetical protein